MKMNIGKYFWRQSFLADLLPALQVSENLMPEMPFYLQYLVFSKKLKVTTIATTLTKVNAHPSFA